ncbi:MAG: (deoxy)nucleoside triphosphate pyrophosphohydrolase [Nitrospirae bacterium]|nr:(deoxy)nucleoside triphosphate pyrophosphohydrolase [Nitrospirota bacterium]NTW66250.1 (deoxy)nucleoside triphosphate pyrophosphohydrolase [Nitrospirota bacterium]
MAKEILQVACAIIERDDKVLAVQRSERMNLPLKWEFPGGKIHQGEPPGHCVVREVSEELNLQIAVSRSLSPVCHDYPDFSVTLYPFICSIVSGEITLHEHKALLWLSPPELWSLDWVAADFPLIAAYCRQRNRKPA